MNLLFPPEKKSADPEKMERNKCPAPDDIDSVGPPLMEITLNGTKAIISLDTCSGRSVATTSFFNIFFPDPTVREKLLKPTAVRMVSATGHQLEVIGYFEAEIKIGTLPVFHFPIIVFKSDYPEVLLGNDIIRDRIVLDQSRFANIDTKYGKEKIPLIYQLPEQSVVSQSSISIKPNHCRRITAKILRGKVGGETPYVPAEAMQNRIAHVFGNDNFNHEVKESVSLINPGLTVEVLLENRTPDKMFIPAGQVVATLDCFDSNQIYELVKREVKVTTKTKFIKKNNKKLKKNDKNANRMKISKRTEKSRTGRINQIDSRGFKEILQGRNDGLLPDPAGYEVELDNRSLTRPAEMEPVDFNALNLDHLTLKQQIALKVVLEKNRAVFARSAYDIGLTDLATYKIDTGNAEPAVQAYRPIPFKWLPEVTEKLQALVKADVIEESDSAWAANLVFVYRDGKLRICTDLTSVNALMINVNQWPINHIADSFDKFVNSQWRSLLDCTAAFWAIAIGDKESMKKTAFYGPGCLYHWKRAPFGMKDIPAIYNQIMYQIVKQFTDFCTFFFDDLALFSQTFPQACEHLDTVLTAVREAGFKLSLKKCHFLYPSSKPLDWLGFVVKENMIHMDPKKVKSILDMPPPITKKELQGFLGSINYLSRHIPNFAHFAAPLWDATSGVKKGAIEWGHPQIIAFNAVKRALQEAPALRMADLDRSFILTTDASDLARGWCLSQEFDEGERAIAYGSKKFSKEEQVNLTMPEKELAAGIAAFVTCYSYLIGKKFLWRVDAKALVFMKKFQKSHTRIAKFAHLMQGYSFDIEHQAAEDNTMMMFVDMLSRSYANEGGHKAEKTTYKELKLPVWNSLKAPPGLPEGRISLEEFNTFADSYICQFDKEYVKGYLPNPRSLDEVPLEEKVSEIIDEHAVHPISLRQVSRSPEDRSIAVLAKIDESKMPKHRLTESGMTIPEFIKVQRADSDLNPLMELARSDRQKGSDFYFFKKEILMRQVSIHSEYTIQTVVVPTMLREPIMSFYHGTLPGTHVGHKKMLRWIRRLYYWPHMSEDIKKHSQSCLICAYYKPHTVAKPSAHKTVYPTAPNELVSIDLVVNLPRSYDGNRHILTMVDEFSKFAMAVPIPDKSGQTVAKAFIKHWFSIFGMPQRWHSDQGTDTDAAVAQYLATILNCQKSRTPAYSPQANGACEAFNKLLGESIKMQLAHSDLKTWPILIPFLTSAYNATTHSKTECSPNEVTFGRNPSNQIIPVVDFEHPIITRSQYLTTIRLAQQYFWDITSKNILKYRRQREPEELKLNPYEVGDFVFIKKAPDPNEPKKAGTKYEGPYRVLKRYPNSLTVMHWQKEPKVSTSRLYHQGLDHIPYKVKMTHPSNCKPMRMPVLRSPLYDPNLARMFLKQLGFTNAQLDEPMLEHRSGQFVDYISVMGTADLDRSDNSSCCGRSDRSFHSSKKKGGRTKTEAITINHTDDSTNTSRKSVSIMSTLINSADTFSSEHSQANRTRSTPSPLFTEANQSYQASLSTSSVANEGDQNADPDVGEDEYLDYDRYNWDMDYSSEEEHDYYEDGFQDDAYSATSVQEDAEQQFSPGEFFSESDTDQGSKGPPLPKSALSSSGSKESEILQGEKAEGRQEGVRNVRLRRMLAEENSSRSSTNGTPDPNRLQVNSAEDGLAEGNSSTSSGRVKSVVGNSPGSRMGNALAENNSSASSASTKTEMDEYIQYLEDDYLQKDNFMRLVLDREEADKAYRTQGKVEYAQQLLEECQNSTRRLEILLDRQAVEKHMEASRQRHGSDPGSILTDLPKPKLIGDSGSVVSSSTGSYAAAKYSRRLDEAFKERNAKSNLAQHLENESDPEEIWEDPMEEAEWDNQGLSLHNSNDSEESNYHDSFEVHEDSFRDDLREKEDVVIKELETEHVVRDVLQPRNIKANLGYRDPKESLAPSFRRSREDKALPADPLGPVPGTSKQHEFHRAPNSPREYVFNPSSLAGSTTDTELLPDVTMEEETTTIREPMDFSAWQRAKMQSRESMGRASPPIPILRRKGATSTLTSQMHRDAQSDSGKKRADALLRSAYGLGKSAAPTSSHSSATVSSRGSGRPIRAAAVPRSYMSMGSRRTLGTRTFPASSIDSGFDKGTLRASSGTVVQTRSGRESRAPSRYSPSTYSNPPSNKTLIGSTVSAASPASREAISSTSQSPTRNNDDTDNNSNAPRESSSQNSTANNPAGKDSADGGRVNKVRSLKLLLEALE